MKIKNPLTKTFTLAALVLAVTASTSTAFMTIDLRASHVDAGLGTVSGNGKSVAITGTTGNITFQIWAQVTNAAAIAGDPFGVVQVIGSIASTSLPGSAAGAMNPVVLGAPFNVNSQTGTVRELSTVADGITDLGGLANSISPTTDHLLLAKTAVSGGSQVVAGGLFYASNLVPVGATFNAITNGFEFLMGTATLSITNFSSIPGTTVSMNWVVPQSFNTPSKRNQIALWTEGDNVQRAAGGIGFLPTSGAAVVLAAAVPEPSAFGMLALGALGLVGFRRMGLRRTA